MSNEKQSMHLSINGAELIKGIAKASSYKFPNGEPTKTHQIYNICGYIIDGVIENLEDNKEDPGYLAFFAKKLGLDKYIKEEDSEDSEESWLSDDAKEELKNLLEDFLKRKG